MHFCLTGQYTPRALNNIMENPNNQSLRSGQETDQKAAGGKLISMYSTPLTAPAF